MKRYFNHKVPKYIVQLKINTNTCYNTNKNEYLKYILTKTIHKTSKKETQCLYCLPAVKLEHVTLLKI